MFRTTPQGGSEPNGAGAPVALTGCTPHPDFGKPNRILMRLACVVLRFHKPCICICICNCCRALRALPCARPQPPVTQASKEPGGLALLGPYGGTPVFLEFPLPQPTTETIAMVDKAIRCPPSGGNGQTVRRCGVRSRRQPRWWVGAMKYFGAARPPLGYPSGWKS